MYVPRKPKSSRTGFTLIEMMVVISIIGIILSFTGRSNSMVLERSRDAALMREVAALRIVIHQFTLDSGGEFPESLEVLTPKYLKIEKTHWKGSRGKGVYHYDSVIGMISLYDDNGIHESSKKDAKGISYGEY